MIIYPMNMLLNVICSAMKEKDKTVKQKQTIKNLHNNEESTIHPLNPQINPFTAYVFATLLDGVLFKGGRIRGGLI